MRGRHLIGSDIVILLAIVMHLYDAAILAASRSADGSIPVAALLEIFHWHWLTILALVSCSAAAGVGHYHPSLSGRQRLALLIGQQSLLLIPAGGGLYAVYVHHYADLVPRTWQFISIDQFVTIGAPIIYTAAIIARVRRAQ
jgi:hypothetical protein